VIESKGVKRGVGVRDKSRSGSLSYRGKEITGNVKSTKDNEKERLTGKSKKTYKKRGPKRRSIG